MSPTLREVLETPPYLRVCGTCGKEKLSTEFPIDLRRWDGRNVTCKECSAKYSQNVEVRLRAKYRYAARKNVSFPNTDY